MAFLFPHRTVHIVTSHYKENLEWLKTVRWPIVLIDKEGADPTCFTPKTVIPNQGREASSYLRYIIDHYEHLPMWVAFIHGHETAWHQKRPHAMSDMLNHVKLSDDMFESFNGHFTLVPFESRDTDVIQVQKHWSLVQDELGEMPSYEGMTDAGAQFIVSRNRILRHPKSSYQKWYDALMQEQSAQRSQIRCTDLKAKCTIDYELGAFFEYVWHVIFGELWTMDPRPFPMRSKKYEWVPNRTSVTLQPIVRKTQDELFERLKNLSLQ
jgi:Protein of unknown function (DUF3431)